MARDFKKMVTYLAPLKRHAENIGIVAIVVPKLKFSDVQRQVFGADLVEGANNTTLQDRPEALNRIRVDGTNNVLLSRMADHFVRVIGPHVLKIRSLISYERGNALINC